MTSQSSVYVAGCFDDYVEIRKIQGILREHGFVISYDWTERAEKTIRERTLRSNLTMSEEATLDLQGVEKADWTILIITQKDYVYRGTFCELGASILRDRMLNKIGHTIILSNPDEDTYAKSLCFFHHPDVIHLSTIEEAILKLRE